MQGRGTQPTSEAEGFLPSRTPLSSLWTASTATICAFEDHNPKAATTASTAVFLTSRDHLTKRAYEVKCQLDSASNVRLDPEDGVGCIPDAVYEELIALTREDDLAGDARKAVWDTFVNEIHSDRVDPLAQALTRQSMEQIYAFFASLGRMEYEVKIFQTPAVQTPHESYAATLLAAFIAHPSTAGYKDIDTLITPYPALFPLLTLIPRDDHTQWDTTPLFAYTRSTLVHLDAQEPWDLPPDLLLDIASKYLSHSPRILGQLYAVVHDVMAHIRDDMTRPTVGLRTFATLRAATYLARGSRAMSHMLLLDGIVGLVEELYYGSPKCARECGESPVQQNQTNQTLVYWCYMVLRVVGQYYDLRDCDVKQELRDDLIAFSRRLSMFLIDPEDDSRCPWI